MAPRTDTFDLGRLRLSAGEARRLELEVAIDSFVLAEEEYSLQLPLVPARLDICRTTGNGYALRLRFQAALLGPCMRCLERATPVVLVDSREVSQPSGEADELLSPYVEHQVLGVAAWARDALALALPLQLLCRHDCAGLCAVCGVDLNATGPDHEHERGADPRWAQLSELRFE